MLSITVRLPFRACCGDGFSIFASDNGIVLTCGEGSSGCLGHGDTLSCYRPRLIETLLRSASKRSVLQKTQMF